MLGFKEIAALLSAVGLLSFQPSATLDSVEPGELRTEEIRFTSTFKGVDSDGQTLVWSSDAPTGKSGLVMRIVPLSSPASSAEAVWPVSATLITRDSTGATMESRLYGIIDWSKQELRLHGNCESGAKSGSSVTALGKFSHLDVTGTLDVLPLTASR